MLATAGIPEVPPVPTGQIWGRETGQWTPISQAGGTFLPIAGGSMQGNINMSGNTITNLAAVPAMPNGAAPAQWVLNNIAAVSLYQGTWDADTNIPDLTQLSTHVNAWTWIAITTSVSGVVIGAAIPGLQGQTVFNGDTIIYSTAQGQFSSIHAGGISLPEADGRYVQLAGSQMSGALLLNAAATQPLQAATFGQLEAAVANTVTPDAPADGQAYLRVGVGTNRWVPGLPLAGGILTGALTLSGPGASGNNAVTVAQLNGAVSGVAAGLLPIAGGTMTGVLTLAGNAAANLSAVPLQQLNATLNTYAPLQNPAFSGVPTVPLAAPGTNTGQIASTAFVQAGFLPLSGGTLSGALNADGGFSTNAATVTGNLGVSGLSSFTGQATFGTQVQANNGYAFGAGHTASLVCTGDFLTIQFGSGSNYLQLTSGGFGFFTGATMNIQGNSGVGISAGSGQITINTPNGRPGADNATGWGIPGAAWFQVASYNFPNESDPRLKNDMQPAPDGAIDAVKAIGVHTFTYKNDATGATHHGFDATEVREHHPNAIMEGDDEMKTLCVNLPDMIAMLWKAVQELSARVP